VISKLPTLVAWGSCLPGAVAAEPGCGARFEGWGDE
jgi:hypothetical protein